MGPDPDRVDTAVAASEGGLLRSGETVLIACSGGADSVALAAALSKLGRFCCAIGHVDHGLRGGSSADAKRVASLAEKLGAPFHLETLQGIDVRADGLEAAARAARYASLQRLARQARATAIATAHTRRDQAETLLVRLLRGAGPGALAGIRKERALGPGLRLVRPLLAVSREDTEAYCAREGLAFSMDPHNVDPARLRARVRALWPSLLALNPQLEAALAGAAVLLADEDDLLSAVAAEEIRAARTAEGLKFSPLHPSILRRAILAASVQAGGRPERRHIESLVQAVLHRSSAIVDLPGARAFLHRGVLRFRRAEEPAERPPPAEVAVAGPGSYRWGLRILRVGEGARGIAVNPGKAPFPWTLRGHRPGDRFRPRGGRTKKVSDLWIDAKVPREVRPRLALLSDAQGRLFWVERLRVSDACEPRGTGSIAFALEAEMDSANGALSPRRRGESPSATMTSPEEEPR